MYTQEAVIIRIRSLCKERNISINHLATISAVAPSTVKNIVYGKSKNTGVVTIAKLCNGLDISLMEFFEDSSFCSLEPEIY